MEIRPSLGAITFAIMLIVIVITSNPAVFLAYAGVPSEPHVANAMWIEPSSVDLSTDIHNIGYKFNVTVWVNITTVPSLTQVVTAWQFVISYNKFQLNAIKCGYTEGAKSQFFSNITTVPVDPQFGSLNTTHNFVMHGETWISGPKRTVPGYGSLSWVEFEVIAKPPEGQAYTSLIGLISTGVRICKILDDELTKIQFTAYHSAYKFGTYDIALTNVTPFKNVVGQGYSMNITVTLENQGSFTECFDVSVFYDDTVITLPDGKNHTTTTLPSGDSTTLTLTWNTTGVAKGNHTITAEATQLPGERDTTDNTHVDGWIFVTIPGDVNGDKYVNIKDAVLLGVAFGSKQGEPSYNPNADINSDGFINIKDAVIQGTNFGKSWT